MIRMIQSQSAKNAKAYFDESLAKSDYYLNDQELPGLFLGQIKSRMGLDDTATREVFQQLCDNINPVTGKRLTPRSKANRTVYYDINFHVPKSVSVLHVLTKDNHIIEAFQKSVRFTMQKIEKDVKTTVRRKSAKAERMTGELLWCEFIHQVSRPTKSMPPDPHLHAHCTVLNVTYDKTEKRYKAGQFQQIKQDMPFYQNLFHKHFSDELITLGYKIKRTRTAFEVCGIPEKVITLFSKRTTEINQLAKQHNITDAKELDSLGAKTRVKKQKGLTLAQLKKEWRRQIMKAGMADGDDSGTAIRHDPAFTPEPVNPQDCINFALAHCFERTSVMPEKRVIESALRFAIGKTGADTDSIDKAFKTDKRIIRIKNGVTIFCTTQEVLAEEQHMITLAISGKGQMLPLYNTSPALTLTGEQKDAVTHVLTTADFVSIIEGRAGTGKTTLMKEAVRMIEAAGRRVIVVAPTAQASRGVLRDEGFKDAETVAKLLYLPDLQNSLTGQVLWVDEAGLLSVKELARLLDLAKQKNARVILGGDTQQHSSVARGDGLRVLKKMAGIIPASVNRIYRQTNEQYRKAVEAIAAGNISTGFNLLESCGAIRQEDHVTIPEKLAEDYLAVIQQGKTVLAVSPTHEQGKAVTIAIRTRLQQQGLISDDLVTVTRLAPLNLTEAEKADSCNIESGMVIQFNKSPFPDIKRGEKCVVGTLDNGTIELLHQSGRKTAFCLEKEKSSFELYYPDEMPIAKGDQVVITRNGKDVHDKRLTNGQVLTIKCIDTKGHILAESSHSKVVYSLPSDFGHLNHAYCMTSYISQGKTLDKVIIAQPAATFAASNMKQFYVSVSRGREAVTIYTDDKTALLETVSKDGDRMAGMELIDSSNTSADTALRNKRNKQSSPVNSKDKVVYDTRPTDPVQAKPLFLQTGFSPASPVLTP